MKKITALLIAMTISSFAFAKDTNAGVIKDKSPLPQWTCTSPWSDIPCEVK